MESVLQFLESELSSYRSAYEASESAKAELLNSFNIDTVDTKGNEFAEKYNTYFSNSIKYRSQISDIEQAIYHIKRVINSGTL